MSLLGDAPVQKHPQTSVLPASCLPSHPNQKSMSHPRLWCSSPSLEAAAEYGLLAFLMLTDISSIHPHNFQLL